jgi:hypothetical protein
LPQLTFQIVHLTLTICEISIVYFNRSRRTISTLRALEHRFTALEDRFGAMEHRISAMEDRFAVQEERMSAMLAAIVRVAERLDGAPRPPSG